MTHVIYDGMCLLCVRVLDIVRRLDLNRHLIFWDANSPTTLRAFPGLTAEDVGSAMYLVKNGNLFRGYHAFRECFRTVPRLSALAFVMSLPIVELVGIWAYAVVAHNRRRLGCRPK